jgi:hypothetical protein
MKVGSNEVLFYCLCLVSNVLAFLMKMDQNCLAHFLLGGN